MIHNRTGSSPQFSPGQILNPTTESSSMIQSLRWSSLLMPKSIVTSLGFTVVIGVIMPHTHNGGVKMQPAQALRYE